MAKNKNTKKNVVEIESAATETVTEVKENKSDDNVMISHVELPIDVDVATATTISIDTKKEEVKKAKPIEKETKQPTQNIKKRKPRIDFNYFWNGTYIG